MNYGMYVSAAGALANSYRQDVIANNLANVETVAFKRDLALMRARGTEADLKGQRRFTTAMLEGIGGGTFGLPTFTDFSAASLEATGNPYDLALAGPGFFQVLDGAKTNYTRDGRFMIDEKGRLATVTGHLAVLSDEGDPIVLDRNLDFSVNESGVISQGSEIVARLGIVDFEDTSTLRKQGDNFITALAGNVPHGVGSCVKQKHLESSGVNAIEQLTEMIRAQRMFQTNISMLQLQDQTLGLAVSRLGSINV